MSLFILQTIQKFGEATGDALRAFLSRILKNLAFTISKPIFITYNTPFYNIPYNKTSIFLTLHLNIISLLLFIFFISHSPSVSLSHYLSIFLNPVRLLPPSDICSQNFRGLSFSSSSLINHGHSHNHGHHHHHRHQQTHEAKNTHTEQTHIPIHHCQSNHQAKHTHTHKKPTKLYNHNHDSQSTTTINHPPPPTWQPSIATINLTHNENPRQQQQTHHGNLVPPIYCSTHHGKPPQKQTHYTDLMHHDPPCPKPTMT